MDKKKLLKSKKKLLALSLVGVMIGTTGCASDKNSEPSRMTISEEYNNIEDYYKYVIQNGEAVKLYNSQNVYLLYNKETFEVNEYIFNNQLTWFGGGELYDLESEELLVYSNGLSRIYNEEFYNYLLENNYQVCLNSISDYVEGHISKDYYSLDEIKELEPLIEQNLKIINKAKVKTK